MFDMNDGRIITNSFKFVKAKNEKAAFYILDVGVQPILYELERVY